MSDLSTPEVAGIAAICFALIRFAEKLVVTAFAKNGKNGNGSTSKSGDLPPSEWDQRIERTVEKVVENKILGSLATIHSGINDMKQSLMILIRWKGGD